MNKTAYVLAIFFQILTMPVSGHEAGWHYSPIPAEGDRATLGCDRNATPNNFTCVAVRCEDDFSTGIYVHTSRANALGTWEVTVDKENAILVAEPSSAPYSGRVLKNAEWLLDRVRQGTFIYLRHADDPEKGFAYIGLGGSLYAINDALSYCAPRVPPKQ